MNNIIDFQIYKFKLYRKEKIVFIIDMILFAISITGFLNEGKELAGNFKFNSYYIWLIVGMSIKLMWDIYNAYDNIKSQRGNRAAELENEKIDISQIEPSAIELENKFKRVECGSIKTICKECEYCKNTNDYVLQSDYIDEILFKKQDIVIMKDKSKENRIKNIIISNKESLTPFLNWQYGISKFYGKHFFNQQKLCLSQDLYSNIENGIIYCHKGTYYDTFLTNHISGKTLQSTKDDSIIGDARGMFPVEIYKDKVYMKEITRSDMNNEIGVSTIGITKDNYIIFWRQNIQAQSSVGLLVPTGSGSCDWDDLDHSKNFNDTIIGAMKRELWEESSGKNYCNNYKDIGETKIIGFFRWIIKGGKPEFVGITKINSSYTDIRANNKEVYEGIAKKISTEEELKNFLDEMLKEKLSTPLYMNIYCLKNHITKGSDEDKKAIFEFLLSNDYK